ncbi:MAG: hypothetical protein OEV67_11205 [Betaproteobacteria bacterium]|nr:hypothetical protein [Betaproteobacteria bacterium]
MRACNPCTACCDGWLKINIQGQAVHQGKPCAHSSGNGCRIYAERPVDPCVYFKCGWLGEDSTLPEWMKPVLAKVIFLPAQSAWRGLLVDMAVPVGRSIPQRALIWLRQHAEKSNRPLIWTENLKQDGEFTEKQNVYAYGPVEFQEKTRKLVIEHDGSVRRILNAMALPPAFRSPALGTVSETSLPRYQ